MLLIYNPITSGSAPSLFCPTYEIYICLAYCIWEIYRGIFISVSVIQLFFVGTDEILFLKIFKISIILKCIILFKNRKRLFQLNNKNN